jgi:hypothetical protein
MPLAILPPFLLAVGLDNSRTIFAMIFALAIAPI